MLRIREWQVGCDTVFRGMRQERCDTLFLVSFFIKHLLELIVRMKGSTRLLEQERFLDLVEKTAGSRQCQEESKEYIRITSKGTTFFASTPVLILFAGPGACVDHTWPTPSWRSWERAQKHTALSRLHSYPSWNLPSMPPSSWNFPISGDRGLAPAWTPQTKLLL